MPEAARPNQRWSLDFVSDTFGASRRFRILAVIDDCCRENLCLVADTSISGARVARELDALDDARRKLPLWRHDYNNVRPHSSLGNQTPAQARRTLEQFEGSAPGALAQPESADHENQTRRLSS